MKVKPMMTWSASEKKLRLFRLILERGTVGDGTGYSACFSVALVRKMFVFKRISSDDARIVILGLSFHYMRSYGGRFA